MTAPVVHPVKACRHCGVEFTPKRSDTLTCSKKCNRDFFHARERERRQASKETRDCATCGSPFVPFRDSSRTCSESCYRTYVLRLGREDRAARRLDPTECVYCGVTYTPRLKTQTRCGSPKCAHAHRRAIDKHRASHLARKFGITPDEYDRMLEAQGNVCAICNAPCATGRRLAVDHDHRTGAIRGLLCFRCNVVLGKFDDDLDLFASATTYLRSHHA